MKKYFSSVILVFFLTFSCTSGILFAETSSTTPEPYKEDEFPQWAHDLRRTEIITFGSLPFVTLGVSIGYGAYGYFTGEFSSFPNPLDKSTDSFSSWQQFKIFATSLGISAGLGTLDLAITLIKRRKAKKKQQLLEESSTRVNVRPLKEPLFTVVDEILEEE